MVHSKRPSQPHRRGEVKGFLATFNTLQGLGKPMQQTAKVRILAVSKAHRAYRDTLGFDQTPWRESRALISLESERGDDSETA